MKVKMKSSNEPSTLFSSTASSISSSTSATLSDMRVSSTHVLSCILSSVPVWPFQQEATNSTASAMQTHVFLIIQKRLLDKRRKSTLILPHCALFS